MEIKAVVFDFGGVMTTSTMPQRVIELAKEKGVDWEVFRRGFEAHRLDYDAGRITLAEMYGLIWGDAGLSVDAETTAAFMAADDRSWCYRNERTLAWMKALKARGFGIGILTNMAPRFAREHFESVFADFIAVADAMVISGDEGIVKPQREIYDLLRGRIGLPAPAAPQLVGAKRRHQRKGGKSALHHLGKRPYLRSRPEERTPEEQRHQNSAERRPSRKPDEIPVNRHHSRPMSP